MALGHKGSKRNLRQWVAMNVSKAGPDILSTEEFRRSLRGNDYGYDTDWYDEITRTPHTTSTNTFNRRKHQEWLLWGELNYKKANGLDYSQRRKNTVEDSSLSSAYSTITSSSTLHSACQGA
jgi:hypothetical protein